MAVRFVPNSYAVGSAFLNTPRITQMCWLKVLSLPATQHYGIITFVNGLGSAVTDKDLVILSTGQLDYQCYDGNERRITTAAVITPGVWFHAAATVGNSLQKIYINGVEAASGPCNDTYTSYNTPNIHVGVGPTRTDTGTRYLNGVIAEVAIWTEALSVAQVWMIANRLALPEQVKPESLNILWPFYQPGATPDRAGSRNDATLGGTYYVETHPPQTLISQSNYVAYEEPVPDIIGGFYQLGWSRP